MSSFLWKSVCAFLALFLFASIRKTQEWQSRSIEVDRMVLHFEIKLKAVEEENARLREQCARTEQDFLAYKESSDTTQALLSQRRGRRVDNLLLTSR